MVRLRMTVGFIANDLGKVMLRRTISPCLAMCFVLSIVCNVSQVLADVKLPSVFSDHMVLQRDTPIKIWGWAERAEYITVTLGDHSLSTPTDKFGNWTAILPPMLATNQPQVLKVSGKNTIEIRDVLIGEVWLCSGQSNMEWRVERAADAATEIAAGDYPEIRHFDVPHRVSPKPLDDVSAKWEVCSPASVNHFTAVGYFMARKLHQELKVPIGLLNASWGGTRIEPWTPPEGLRSVPALESIYDSVIGRTPGSPSYRKRLDEFLAANDRWASIARRSRTTNTLIDPPPAYPTELISFGRNTDPTVLFNGMVNGLVGYSMRGAIWYQGESNHTEGMLYFEKKKALIKGWRDLWGLGDFPFYFVQIAPFDYNDEQPETLAELWEAQSAAAAEIPNTGMVVTNDIATLKDIHPPNKQDVGIRLANLALRNDYGRAALMARSPSLRSYEVVGRKLRVMFDDTAGGLKTRDGKPPTYFEIAGRKTPEFVPAVVDIDGDSVLLRSDDVTEPVAFRFAWHKLAEPNLTGGTGLPVPACRGGKAD